MSFPLLTHKPITRARRPRQLNFAIPRGWLWPLDPDCERQLKVIINAQLGRRQRKLNKTLPQCQDIFPPVDTWPLWFYARDKEAQADRATEPRDALIAYCAAQIARAMAQGYEAINFHGTYLETGQGGRIFNRFTRKLNEGLYGKRYRRGGKGITAIGAIETTRDKTRAREFHEHIHAVMAGEKFPDRSVISSTYWAAGGGIHKVEPIKDTEQLEKALGYAFKAYPESKVIALGPKGQGSGLEPIRARKWPLPSAPSLEIQVEP